MGLGRSGAFGGELRRISWGVERRREVYLLYF